MSFYKQLSELSAARAQLDAAEKSVHDARDKALVSLPAEYGYADLNSFVKALKAAGKTIKGKRGKAKPVIVPKKGKRARLTPTNRLGVVEAAKAGKGAAKIADEFGISIATVHNIRKAAGLVKARSTSAPSAPAVDTPQA